jgi:hypothetical protein
MRWKDRVSRLWISPAGRNWRLAEPKTAPKIKDCISEDQKLAAGCIITGSRELKWKSWILPIVVADFGQLKTIAKSCATKEIYVYPFTGKVTDVQ